MVGLWGLLIGAYAALGDYTGAGTTTKTRKRNNAGYQLTTGNSLGSFVTRNSFFYVQVLMSFQTSFHRFPRPEPVGLGSAGRIPGGRRMPRAAGRLPDDRALISTRAFARASAGTTQVLQLHWRPCQANFPILDPHVGLGQVRRPDNGASPAYWAVGSVSDAEGYKLERIHFMGCKKM